MQDHFERQAELRRACFALQGGIETSRHLFTDSLRSVQEAIGESEHFDVLYVRKETVEKFLDAMALLSRPLIKEGA